MKTKTRRDSILLAITLFAVSGMILAYNLHTVDNIGITVSLYELWHHEEGENELISTYTAGNLNSGQSIFTGGTPENPPTADSEAIKLEDPIVTPPTK